MQRPQIQLLGSDIAKLAAVSSEQARHLTELNWWAVDGGIEHDVTDGQVLTFMRHQTALAGMILTLINERAKRKASLPLPTFLTIPVHSNLVD